MLSILGSNLDIVIGVNADATTALNVLWYGGSDLSKLGVVPTVLRFRFIVGDGAEDKCV